MRPILLKGHERALTQVKYNREGDLILTVSKDSVASIWYSFNGERLGTLNGHIGTIWSIDILNDSSLALTGSADFTAKLWSVQTGKNIFTYQYETPVRRVEFSPHQNNKALLVTDEVMGIEGTITILTINTAEPEKQNKEPLLIIKKKKSFSKITVAGWSYLDKYIIAGHNDGSISKFDAKTGEFISSVKEHSGVITDLQFSKDRTYFITSSKDKSAKIFDVDTLKLLKVYVADAPMNSALITPVKDFVVLGGGQEARDVTTTSSEQGKFEARFYHKIFQDEIGRVKGHFGPLNYVAVHPLGIGYSSGGEDGYVRVHVFDKPYFDFQYDVERTANSTIV
ncbi:translation initiation factor eIF3 subunit i [Ascoidea rubescens DSM 1968]|uniref:Eukaryotic translation initiation factor 3 subunit I n=1 Tax=Ascoidea rubescens DSM 1968 TaxID=1344418 RepID=A0A1D2VQV0_9ASCO|nr:subunit of the core complex of translation initiation factor [Ascoidea rubescens DSM 1968]ODV63996.1 subunit of the core complex of translation initiation factor [Ascoidea rubescens DSM 1968]